MSIVFTVHWEEEEFSDAAHRDLRDALLDSDWDNVESVSWSDYIKDDDHADITFDGPIGNRDIWISDVEDWLSRSGYEVVAIDGDDSW